MTAATCSWCGGHDGVQTPALYRVIAAEVHGEQYMQRPELAAVLVAMVVESVG